MALVTNIRYDFGLQVTRRPEIKCAVEYAIALSVIHNSLIIIAHDGRADSLKAIAPKPIVVHESYFYMVFNHYIFMSIIAIFMSFMLIFIGSTKK